eukprot:c20973_g1_i1.p1 GENE.c20973_g1_i1~~c20973_g1_i1.p1  ORF type:complete len:324 (+),score=65.53 c20973_g1_i1:51-974(+)
MVDFTANKLKEMPDLRSLLQATEICLRQNYITILDKLPRSESGEPVALTSLDIYDNKLASLEGLEHLTSLTYLDASFNELRTTEHLSSLTELTELYLIQNKIVDVGPEIRVLTQLRLLELGSNRIRQISNLETLVNLRKLFLGRNKITSIQGLETLTNLRCLSLQNNRLTTISGLETLTNLDELYLSRNGISQIQGLESLRRLRILDLSDNPISVLDNLEALTELEDLWCSTTKISSYDQIKRLSQHPKLTTLYLQHSPIASTPDYRFSIMCLLPNLTQLDADDVTPGEKATVTGFLARKQNSDPDR